MLFEFCCYHSSLEHLTFGVIRTIWSKSIFGARVAFRRYYVFGVKGKASELFRF